VLNQALDLKRLTESGYGHPVQVNRSNYPRVSHLDIPSMRVNESGESPNVYAGSQNTDLVIYSAKRSEDMSPLRSRDLNTKIAA
jgi:hypothetical protein